MYLNHEESLQLAREYATLSYEKASIRMVVFPTLLSATSVQEIVNTAGIDVGAQHAAWTPKGAYTGAVSMELLQSANISYALIGHSERRHVFGESNEDTHKRLQAAIDAGITPVLCVGDTKDDVADQKQEYRIKKQLLEACQNITGLEQTGIYIAYEPVWAISQAGVGTACSPEEAKHMLHLIREEMKQYTTQPITCLYGGSVTPQNVLSYITQEGIDGVLVGSASVHTDEYKALVHAVSGDIS